MLFNFSKTSKYHIIGKQNINSDIARNKYIPLNVHYNDKYINLKSTCFGNQDYNALNRKMN